MSFYYAVQTEFSDGIHSLPWILIVNKQKNWDWHSQNVKYRDKHRNLKYFCWEFFLYFGCLHFFRISITCFIQIRSWFHHALVKFSFIKFSHAPGRICTRPNSQAFNYSNFIFSCSFHQAFNLLAAPQLGPQVGSNLKYTQKYELIH